MIPALVIRLELEGVPQMLLEAGAYEDEQRMRGWLRRSGALDGLRAQLEGVLDVLDGIEEMPS